MKVADLVARLQAMPQDADVYYSTGSGMDDRIGDKVEVEHVGLDVVQVGIFTPTPHDSTIVVLEGS
jgi:hypothetical protein